MPLVEQVEGIFQKSLDEVAQRINYELKQACPKRTGEAAASIHIENTSKTSRFIGGENDHLFFADQGNNQSTGMIYPDRAKALKFTDGSFHARARTYEGKHFVKDVADRHR